MLQFTAHIGQIGGLAFFVHTSLVLMYSLERLAQRPTGGSIATRFYIRRFFRIYPLSIACVAVVLLLGIPPLPWRETPPYGANVIIANLLLVQNLYTGQSVLGPLWSLPYEVEMYILLPLLFFVARKKSGVGSLQLLIAAACAGGIALAFITHGRLNLAAYAPCFLAGVLCYALQSRQKAVLPATLWPLWIVVLIVSYCLLHTQSPQPVYWMGWILCLILGWTINLFRDGRNHRAVNVLADKIALYSYGLYLIHVPVLYLVFDVWRMRNVPAACATYFGLTLLFSVMTYHTLEKPMIDVGRRLSERPTSPAPQAASGA